jgi:hypothetical protein
MYVCIVLIDGNNPSPLLGGKLKKFYFSGNYIVPKTDLTYYYIVTKTDLTNYYIVPETDLTAAFMPPQGAPTCMTPRLRLGLPVCVAMCFGRFCVSIK